VGRCEEKRVLNYERAGEMLMVEGSGEGNRIFPSQIGFPDKKRIMTAAEENSDRRVFAMGGKTKK